MSFRHRNSWQDAGRIKLNRSELLRFIYDRAEKYKVNYESPASRRLLYQAGVLKNGQTDVFKRDLLKPTNIRSHSRTQSERSHEEVYHVDDAKCLDGPVLHGE